ncbi:GNAT family N-acetyltransferase [Streptomyces sp. NPDC001728]|uniref:GNAT family N-acetyltransferase n=1 Tax=Streptomyces sp. NPDC001728 TaxID=3154396 RepID=UPI003331616F
MPASSTPAPGTASPPVPSSPLPLATERLLLRPVRAGDVPAVTRLWTDPQVRRHLGGPVTEHVVRIRQRRVVGAPGVHAVVRATDGVLLGLVTVEPAARDGETEISYQFLPEHWGRGYAREAVAAVLDITLRETPSVVALTQQANHRSRRLLEDVGMTHVSSFVEFEAHQVLYRRRS